MLTDKFRRPRRNEKRNGRNATQRLLLESLEDRRLLAIDVAVVASGMGSSYYDAGLSATVNQINDSPTFDFNATLVQPSAVDTTAELGAFDVVVIGNNGRPDGDRFSQIGPALQNWVQSGGGIVATGWTVYGAGTSTGSPVSAIDDVIPVNTSGSYSYYGAGAIISATGPNHPVTTGVSSFQIASGNYAEFPGTSPQVDSGATVLGTVNGQPTIAIGQSGTGKSVYLGPIYSGHAGYNTSQLRSGSPDRLMEQAVAWAGGALPADETPPEVIATNPANGSTIVVNAFSTITVEFNEKVTTATAQDTANYRLEAPNGQVPISSASLAASGMTVTLSIAAQTTPGIFELYVGGVSDLAGNEMDSVLPVTVFSTNAPQALAVADFDGDGMKDIVVHQRNGRNLSFWKGLGNGDFDATPVVSAVTTGNFAKEMVPADIDGDGNLDLVVAEEYVGVYHGLGDGRFVSDGVRWANYARSVSVADIDGDLDLDIVAGSPSSGITTLLSPGGRVNLGSGAWVQRNSGAPSSYDSHVADMNNDGRLDFVGADFNSAFVSLGNPDGTFSYRHGFTATGTSEHTALADVDADGYVDLAGGRYGTFVTFGTTNQGTNNSPYFSSVQQLSSSGGSATNVSAVDLDADGDLDLIKGGYGDGLLHVSTNQGGRSFANSTIDLNPYGVRYTWVLETPDLNGDGIPEIIGTDFTSNRVFVLTSDAGVPASQFSVLIDQEPPTVLRTNPADGTTLLGEDFSSIEVEFSEVVTESSAENLANYRLSGPNGDAALSSAVIDNTGTRVALTFPAQATEGAYELFVGSVADLAGNAMPSIASAAAVSILSTTQPMASVAGDFNGDGIEDLVVQNYNTSYVTFFEGQSDGTLSTTPVSSYITTGRFAKEMVAADIDGDGNLDLVVAEEYVGVYHGIGDGRFVNGGARWANYARSVSVADIDGDLDLDIVAGSPNGNITTLLNPGGRVNLGSGVWVQRGSGAPGSYDSHLADMNNDGRLDFVGAYFNSAFVSLGNSDGTFSYRHGFTATGTSEHTALADVDADGHVDLAGGRYGTFVTYGTANQGTNNSPYFSTVQQLNSSGGSATNVSAVDLEADGDLDLIKGGYGDGLLHVSTNQGGRSFANSTIDLRSYGIRYTWVLQTPDLNDDGLPEIIGTDWVNHRIFVLTSQSGTYAATVNVVPNQPPVADTIEIVGVEDENLVIQLTGTDPDGDPLQAIVQTLPGNGSLYQYDAGQRGAAISADDLVVDTLRRVVFVANEDENGINYTGFDFTLNDGLVDSNTGTVSITITPVNDRPVVADPVADVDVGEDATNTVLDISNVFSDVDLVDGDQLTYSIQGNSNTSLLGATLDGTTLTLAYAQDQNGTADITLRATDEADEFVDDTFQITVTAIADQPTLSVSDVAGDEAASIPLSIIPSLVDTDGSESLSIEISAIPAVATFSNTAGDPLVPASGVLTLTPAQLAGLAITMPDDDYFALTVTAKTTESSNSDVAATSNTLNVTGNNIAPTLTVSGPLTVNEGSTYTLNLSSSDPGDDTISQWTINWGDGTPEEIVTGNPSTVDHVYVDGLAIHTILATATDEDGTYEAAAFGGNAIVSPDPSFGNGGEVRTDFFGSTADNTIDLSIVLPDGKVLVAGRAVGGNSNIALAQYLPNGDLDPNFGSGGKVFTELGGEEYTEAMVVDSSGRIIVGGNYGIVRYLPDGSLDNTFGVNGLLTILTSIRDLALDSQERIVASTGYYVQRFNADSSADQSFNNGQRLYTYNLMGSSYSEDMEVDTSDRIVLVGQIYTSFSDNPATPNFNENNNSHHDMTVGRLTAAGQLDTSFAASGPTSGGYANLTYHSGYARVDFGGRSDLARSVIVQGSDIVVGGYTQPLYDSVGQTYFDPAGQTRHDADLALLRLDANGALDASFGVGGVEGNGVVQTHLGSWDYLYSLGLDSQSGLMVGTGSGYWTRYSADGVLDMTLNPTSSYPGRVTSYVSTVYGIQEWIDPGTGDRFVFTSGNRYIGGNEGSNFAVAKHNWDDGSLDPTFGPGGNDHIDGLVSTDFQGSQYDEVRDLVLTQPDGKILVAGYKSGGVQELVLARYLPDGSLDPTFGASDGDGVDGVVIDGRYSSPQALAIDSVGRIVVAYSNQLLRYNSDGTPDNTFGPGTSDNRAYANSQLNYIYDIEVDAADKIIAGGYRYVQSPDATIYSYDFAVARYNPDGTLDNSFSNGDADGVDGVNYLDFGSSDPVRSEDWLNDIAIDGSGRILATGYSYAYDYDASQYIRYGDIAVARYNADGTLDASFGVGSSSNSDNSQVIENINGLVLTDFNKNSWEYGYAVTVDNQGRVYAGGNNYLAAYNPDGTLDTNFAGGKVNVTGSIRSLAIDAADNVVMAGSNRLSRYLTDGTPDTDFAANGTLYLGDRYVEAVSIDSSGRIVVGGRTGSSGPSGVDFYVARYLTGGLSVTVNNVAPQNVSVTGTTSTDEGQLISLSASATDPAGIYDPLTYTWSITRNNVAFLQTSGQNISFTAPDDGTYKATMTVDDGDGGSVTVSHTTTVANLDPTPSIDTISTTRVEGTQIDVTASATDPAGANDTLTYSYEVFKDGATTAFASGSGVDQTNFNFTPDDNGSYKIVLTVSDEDGGSASVDQTITVDNVAPVVTAAADQTVAEGSTLSLDVASFTDVGTLDTHSAQIDWGDGSAVDVGTISESTGSGTISGSHVYADNGSYTVTVRVADDDMTGDFATGSDGTDFVEKTFTVTVNNVDPTLTVAADQTVNEGTLLSLTNIGSFTDPGFDNALNTTGETEETFDFVINWGDGTTADTGTATVDTAGSAGTLAAGSFDGSHTYADNGTYTVTVTVNDDDTGSDTETFTVTVNNVDPTLSVAADQTVNEGKLLSLTNLGSFTDPGFDNALNATGETEETFDFVINWGDGTTADTGTATVDTAGSAGTLTAGSFDGSHTYADNGTYTVTVTVNDDDTGSDTETFTVTVNNVDPTLSVAADQTVNEGTLLSLTNIGSFTDPGFDNALNATGETEETFDFVINWGDGTTADTGTATVDTTGSAGTLTAGSFDGSHTYADNGTYTVTVTVNDDDTGSDTETFTVTVNNVDPTLTVAADQTVNEGTLLSLTNLGSFTDPGFDNALNTTGETEETFDFVINWGDGTATDTGAATVDTAGSAGTLTAGSFDGSHTYADNGTYTVTVTVNDDDTGSDTETFTVTVNNVDPTLTVAADQTVNEGTLLSLTNIGSFTDPGFDNALNATGETEETFDFVINWGDGTTADTGTATVDTAGSAGTLTAGSFDGSHTYADNGTYTVTVTVSDDDTGSDTETFTVTVNNVDPTLTVAADQTVNEGTLLSLTNLGSFTDPGFDNALNATGETEETFDFVINWGDGTTADTGTATVDTAGSAGTLTAGSFDGSHTYADNGTYTVTVTVNDDDTGSDTETFTVTVNNVDPTLTVAADQTVNEGTLLSLTNLGSFTDPGFDNALNTTGETEETFDFVINWGDGTATDTGAATVDTAGSAGTLTAGSFDGSHTYADNGTYTVTVTVNDDDTGSDTETFTVTVNNVDPTLTVAADQTVNEGTLLSLTNIGSFTDPGFDNALNTTGETEETFDFVINWGDGTTADTGTATVETAGSAGTLTAGSFDGSHTYADNGTYTVTVTVNDDDTGSDIETFIVTVNNVDPDLEDLADQTANEGQYITLQSLADSLTPDFNDPGFDNGANTAGEVAETFTATIDWGDGTTEPVGDISLLWTTGSEGVDTAGTIDATHAYADNGTYTVTVVVNDDDTGSDTETFTVTVNNVNPDLEDLADQTANEGQYITLQSLADSLTPDFNDPGFDNGANTAGEVAETFTATIDWGDGTTEPVGDISLLWTTGSEGVDTAGTIDATHAYADNGTYTVTVVVNDDDTGSDTETFTVTVANVNPTLTVVPTQTVDEGILLSLPEIGTFTDPGFDNAANAPGETEETFTYSINWGDATGTDTGTATVDILGSEGVLTGGSFDGSHTYADDGTYTVTVEVCDDDSGCDTQMFDVIVLNVAPVVAVDIENQDVQYSDSIDTITFTATDVPADPLNASIAYSKNGNAFIAGLPDDGTIVPGGTDLGLVFTGANPQTTTATYTPSWTISGIADLEPGEYTFRITVDDGDGGITELTSDVTVLQEDAIPNYIAPTYVYTDGSGVLNLELRSVVQDITFFGGADVEGGDITRSDIPTATVTYIVTPLVGSGSPTTITVNVEPIDTDPLTGVAVATFTDTLANNQEIESYFVEIYVDGYYVGETDVMITAARPDGAFITGGGYITEEVSYGEAVTFGVTDPFAALEEGSNINFGYNVKWNKSLTNLQGNFNMIMRAADGSKWHVKSTATRTLGVTDVDGDPDTEDWAAVFTSKANLKNIAGGELEGLSGINMTVFLHDNGEPGSSAADIPDTIGVELWDGPTLIFSTHWNGSETVEQDLIGGNNQVHDVGGGGGGGGKQKLELGDNAAGHGEFAGPLSQETLDTVAAVAIDRWKDAGISDADAQRLDAVQLRIEDLSGTTLGLASSLLVWIDDDAAGHGWSIDISDASSDDARFAGVDLLTAVAHELGHVLGFDHDVMGATLDVGVRELDWLSSDAHRDGHDGLRSTDGVFADLGQSDVSHTPSGRQLGGQRFGQLSTGPAQPQENAVAWGGVQDQTRSALSRGKLQQPYRWRRTAAVDEQRVQEELDTVFADFDDLGF